MARSSSFFQGLKSSFMKSWEEDPFSTALFLVGIIAAIGLRIWLRKKMLPPNRNQATNEQTAHEKKDKPRVVLKEINIYPVKSCAKISVSKWKVGKYGLENDRRWMVINSDTNRFETQRQSPKMALIKPNLTEEYLRLEAPDMPFIQIPVTKKEQKKSPIIEVGIWKDQCMAVDEGDEIANWLQQFLGKPSLRLVRMCDTHDRAVPSKWLPDDTKESFVSFADGFPFLAISLESLVDINEKLSKSLPMNRFRPNLVVSGAGKPFEEDRWKTMKIGEVILHGVKKCTRCKMTTVNQDQGSFEGDEPLSTLKTFRKGLLEGGNEVCFGQNMVHKGEGVIKVNQEVEILEYL